MLPPGRSDQYRWGMSCRGGIWRRPRQTPLAPAPLQRRLHRQRHDDRSGHHRLLLAGGAEAEEALLLRRLQGVGQKVLVVFRADETRVAVLLQQQVVHVLRCPVKGEPVRLFHLLLHPVHRTAIDVDLARRSRRQKFSNYRKKSFIPSAPSIEQMSH